MAEKLILRDRLAIERTKLANERTFLAYFRTGIIFLGTGISIVSIEFFERVDYLGWTLVVVAPAIIAIGLYRLHYTRKTIQSFFLDGLNDDD